MIKNLEIIQNPMQNLVHPEVKNKGINASTGSLGHGLAIAAGLALANRKKQFLWF